MVAYGYIRKSVVHDEARMLSPEMQRDAIQRLATGNGDDHVEIFEDLDVSGRKQRSQRPGWDEVLHAIEDGEAHAVYAYSLSRFTRSLKDLREFTDLCAEKDVRIGVAKESIDNSTAMGRAMLSMIGVIYELESELASERVKDAFAVKRASDPTWDGPGNPKYGSLDGEDIDVVLDAFREAGSYDGGARLLNYRKVPTRKKGGIWSGSVVKTLVERHAPDELLPADTRRRGVSAGPGTFRFSQLISCSVCGAKLTGSTDARTGEARYACGRARTVAHGRGWVNESKLLPVIIEETDHAQFFQRRLQVGSRQDEELLEALSGRRDRVVDLYVDGIIDKAERDRRLAKITSEEQGLNARRWIRRISFAPDIEDGEPKKVNAYLRRLFTSVTVDMSQKAKRGPSKWLPSLDFEWRDPSMRVEDADAPWHDGLTEADVHTPI